MSTDTTTIPKLPPPNKRPARRLVLEPERSQSAAVSHEIKMRINDFVSRARPPEGEVDAAYSQRLEELEKNLRELESSLFAREQSVQAKEAHLAERERTLWETEALMHAREELLRTREKQLRPDTMAVASTAVNPEEREALQRLRDEVMKQQESLKEQKTELKEREQFVEDSENCLLDKTMKQQEEESRLEQMAEDLTAREKRINVLEGKPPPPEVPKEIL